MHRLTRVAVLALASYLAVYASLRAWLAWKLGLWIVMVLWGSMATLWTAVTAAQSIELADDLASREHLKRLRETLRAKGFRVIEGEK